MTLKAYSYSRISSKAQATGGGIRRQIEAARTYAEANGLELIEDIQDIGLSGYHGAHLKDGALGQFLEAVKAGRVERGSVLIVESLDRLSRENLVTAQGQLLSILGAGIEVVSLVDNQRYTVNPDIGQLIMSLATMARAYDESVVKSKRAEAYYQQMKADLLAGKKRYVNNTALWIDQKWDRRDDPKFKLNDKAKIIKDIFQMYADGISTSAISKHFNAKKVPTLSNDGRSKYGLWRDQTILRILRSQTAMGNLKIGTTVVENIYPAAVSPTLWWEANNRLKRVSEKVLAGRKGAGWTNLFAGIQECFHCGMTARVIGGGTGLQYLTCQRVYSTGESCSGVELRRGNRAIPYAPVEYNILQAIELFTSKMKETKPPTNLQNVADEIKEKVAKCETQINTFRLNLESENLDPEDRAYWNKRIGDTRLERNKHQTELDSIMHSISNASMSLDRVASAVKFIKDERIKWNKLEPEELFLSRSMVNSKLREIITKISIDTIDQTVYILVGGATMGWKLTRDGSVTMVFDNTVNERDTVERISIITKNLGLKTSKINIGALVDYNRAKGEIETPSEMVGMPFQTRPLKPKSSKVPRPKKKVLKPRG